MFFFDDPRAMCLEYFFLFLLLKTRFFPHEFLVRDALKISSAFIILLILIFCFVFFFLTGSETEMPRLNGVKFSLLSLGVRFESNRILGRGKRNDEFVRLVIGQLLKTVLRLPFHSAWSRKPGNCASIGNNVRRTILLSLVFIKSISSRTREGKTWKSAEPWWEPRRAWIIDVIGAGSVWMEHANKNFLKRRLLDFFVSSRRS